MDSASTIGKSHPSFGCGQAWFLFAKKDRGGRMEKLLLVEAKTAWAVQTIERMVASDGHAADGLELLTVHRQCPSIGIRSDLVEEVDYADFVSDHADAARVVSDTLTSHAFQNSLDDSGREKVMAERPAPAPEGSTVEDVMAALTDLGYKRAQAQRMVDAVGPSIRDMSIEDAIATALRNGKAA